MTFELDDGFILVKYKDDPDLTEIHHGHEHSNLIFNAEYIIKLGHCYCGLTFSDYNKAITGLLSHYIP